MCGTPDYDSLIVMVQRMLILASATLTALVAYGILSGIRNGDMTALKGSLDRLLSDLGLDR